MKLRSIVSVFESGAGIATGGLTLRRQPERLRSQSIAKRPVTPIRPENDWLGLRPFLREIRDEYRKANEDGDAD
jgi:hypothetical protein